MKKQRIAILVIVLALIVIAEVLLMNRCTGEPASAPRPTATAVPTEEPAETAPTAPPVTTSTLRPGFTSPPNSAGGGSSNNTSPTRAPSATEPPARTQAPEPTAPPTAPPTEPPPAGQVTASNSFSSNTGVGLNMNVSWTATDMGNGTTRLTITGTVNSYELNVMSLPVSISFSGYSASLMGSSINAGSGGMQSNNLFTTSMDVASGTAGTMTVTWNFNGEYSSTPISTITASDFVYTD